VRDERCAACGMIVRPQVLQAMRRSEDGKLFHCETCTRILYLVEPSFSPSPPAADSEPQAGASAASSHES